MSFLIVLIFFAIFGRLLVSILKLIGILLNEILNIFTDKNSCSGCGCSLILIFVVIGIFSIIF